MNKSPVPHDSQPTAAMDQQIQTGKKTKFFQWLTPNTFGPTRSSIEPKDHLWLAWAVLACALALTFVVWRASLQDIETQLRHEFDAEVIQVRSDLDSRLAGYTQTLRAAAALFASSDEVTREDWHNYVAGLRLEQGYPAIQAMAFARVVSQGELDTLVKTVRNTGVADFAIRPPGRRDQYVVNVFAEPYTGLNIKALGYDMWQDADRRDTMQRASQAETPMITSRITLKVDEQSQPVPAFIMYMPVRRKPGAATLGYVLSPFRMPVLMDDLLKKSARTVYLSIHDGSTPRPDNVFYRSAEESSLTAKFTHSEPLLVGGRTWTLSYASRADTQAHAGMSPATKVLAGGLLTGLLLFALVGSLVNTRGRAIRLARSMTHSLRESEENLKITLLSIGDAVIATDRAGRITRMNPVAERLSGWPLADARDRPLADVFRIVNASSREPVTDPVQLVMAQGEVVGLANHTLLLARDGREYQIADSAAPMRNPAGEIVGVVLVFSDVTEHYRAAHALQEQQLFLAKVLESLPGIFYLYSYPANELVLWNKQHETLLGYAAQEMKLDVQVFKIAFPELAL